MHFAKTSFYGNVHIGIFAVATDDYVFCPPSSSKKFLAAFSGFGVEAIPATAAQSGLLGIYICANSNGAILPKSSSEEERRFFKNLGLNVYVISGKWNAAGNNICANDKGAILNQNITNDEIKKIGDCLGVPTERSQLAGYDTVGSVCVATNCGFFASNEISEEEFEFLEEVFGVRGGVGTVNMGVGLVKIGMVANSKGCLMGEATSGYESVNIQEALGIGRDERKAVFNEK
ncbi:MAG: translation initiation factor IF-6 [Candidatus Anstonellales archaeon]